MADKDIALMAHLMRRAGFGAPYDEVEARAAKGYEATVEELLHPEDQPELETDIMERYLVEWRHRENLQSKPVLLDLSHDQHQAPAGGEDCPLLAWCPVRW